MTAASAGLPKVDDGNDTVSGDISVDVSDRYLFGGETTRVGSFFCPTNTHEVRTTEQYGESLVIALHNPSSMPAMFERLAAGEPVEISVTPPADVPTGAAALWITCLGSALHTASIGLLLVDHPFTDVPENAYYTEAVLWAFINDVTTGTGPLTFSPGNDVTRWQMSLFLQRFVDLFELDALAWSDEDTFGDTAALPGYQRTSIGWLASTGITTGVGNNNFAPGDVVTRWQMALFLRRTADLLGLDIDAALDTFDDTPQLAEYQKLAIGWLATTGITTGIGNNQFDPYGTVTRAQMVTFLQRLYDYALSS